MGVKNPEVVALISELLRVKQETLLAALTAKRARASGETLVINYRLPEAIAARDAMAKCLYGALFDWIVLQVTEMASFTGINTAVSCTIHHVKQCHFFVR